VEWRPKFRRRFLAEDSQKMNNIEDSRSMSNITSLSDFRTRRLDAARQSKEEALKEEGRTAVAEVIGPEEHKQRAIEFSARNAKLDEARKSALDHLQHVPGVAVILGLASLAVADLTVDPLPVTSLLLIGGVAVLGWSASGIARELEKSGRTPESAQDPGALDSELLR
jgi:hypothetical protein